MRSGRKIISFFLPRLRRLFLPQRYTEVVSQRYTEPWRNKRWLLHRKLAVPIPPRFAPAPQAPSVSLKRIVKQTPTLQRRKRSVHLCEEPKAPLYTSVLKKIIKPVGLLTLIIATQTQTPKAQTVKADKVTRIETAVPIKNITAINGFIGNRLEKNRTNYLDTFSIDAYIKLVEQRTWKDWNWRKPEQPGKWIESALLTSERTHDTALAAKTHAMLTRIISSQEPEGYIGVTDKTIRTPEKPLRGMDAYELYFLQHALLTAFEEWQDTKSLTAARKLGDYFIQYIGPGKAEFWPSKDRYPDNMGKTLKGTQHSDLAGHSIHYSWEGTLLIDPMMRLYQLTGGQKYLDWCKWVVSRIDVWSGWNAYSKLDSVAAGLLPVNKIQPYVHAHTFQMNFIGFLRMYQVTGDKSYLRKVQGVWDDINRRQTYITGGVSVGEHYERDYIKPLTGEMIETCSTMSWLQLSQYLLELTADTKYADEMEKLIWNQVFAEQTIDGDGNRYFTPPNGFKPNGYFRPDGPDCCTGSGHRVQSILPGFIYGMGSVAKNAVVYVNQFVPSSVALSLKNNVKVVLTQEGNYPGGDNMAITVNPAAPAYFSLAIRMPAWCGSPKVLVNRKPVKVAPGKYAVIARQWKAGDKIELQFPSRLQWVRHEHYQPASDRKPYTATEDSDAPYALQKGPLVYAVDNLYYKGDTAAFPKNVMNEVKYILSDPAGFSSIQTGDDMLGPGYTVPIRLAGGQTTSIALFPFANIGKWYKDVANKPAPESKAYSYGIWLKGIKQ